MPHRFLAPLLVLSISAAACERESPVLLDGRPEGTAAAGVPPSSQVFQAAAEAVLPAVVFVQVEARPADEPEAWPFPRRQQAPPQIGSGSGFIIDERGYVLTNNHVVQQADHVTVMLGDRRQFEALVVARDPSTDVAVLKIEARELPVAELGDSDDAQVGEWVLALGSPLGLLFTTTAGIISAKGRAIGILGRDPASDEHVLPLENFIQTDAVVNPGNSGGPLVNLAGQVIGINTAIQSPTGFFAGYSFAVPINLARRVARDLIEYGHVRRPFLGVTLQEVEPVDVEVYGLEKAAGAEVKTVQPGGPAARAGLEPGDVIVGLGPEPIASAGDLQTALTRVEPGRRVRLEVVRYGTPIEVSVAPGVFRTGLRPEPVPAVRGEVAGGAGFAVVPRGDALLVAAVQPFTAAARAGLRPGQRILAVNRQEVEDVADLTRAIRQAGGAVSLLVEDPALGRTVVNFSIGR